MTILFDWASGRVRSLPVTFVSTVMHFDHICTESTSLFSMCAAYDLPVLNPIRMYLILIEMDKGAFTAKSFQLPGFSHICEKVLDTTCER